MRMTKKVLSIVLAVMMVVSMMSVMAVSANAATGVAEINGTNYETLEAAFAAAVDGDTITVLDDCAGNGIKAPQGKFATNGLTVDFAGHTYTVDGETVGSTGTETNGFQLLKNNKITFKNGAITSEKAKILVQNYSDLTLDKMTLTLNNPNYTSAYTLSDNNGEVVINDTTINANPAGGFAFDVCRFSSYPSVNVTVKGASVINGDVEISASGNDAKDGFSLTLEGGEMYGEVITTPSAAAAMTAAPEKTAIAIDDDFKFYVAKIGSTKYETLEAAFAAAQDGDTITVLADCAGNGIKAPQGKFTTGLTVDFGGHTYTVDGETVGSTGTETNGFQLLKDNKITFKNGTINGSTQETATLLFLIQNYSDLTLDNMNLELVGKYYSQYTLSNNNGNIVINDSTINAPTYGGVVRHDVNSYAFDVCRFSSYPSVKVTVTGNSTINGDVEVSASNNEAKDGFSLTLKSGTMTGDIVVDQTAKTAMAEAPENASVNKAAGFAQAAPEGYMWTNAEQGVQKLTTIPQDDVLTPDLAKENDGNQFKLGDLEYHFGTLLGVQKKNAIAGAEKTSEKEAQENGNDLRFVAVLKTDILRNAQDYGFVLAKVNSSKTTESVAPNINALSADGVGNGEKVISAKGSSNTICGDYGELGTYTSYKYITCAVNGVEDGTKVVARFYVKIGGKTYYAQYPKGGNYDANFTAAVAGVDANGVVY